jgi:hypothetical protein
MLSILLCLVCAQSDELEKIAEKALVKAREHFDNAKWLDCIEQAERARNTYQTLVELYDSQQRDGERRRVEDRVKVCNQLIKLANDKRKAEGMKAENPPPPPPPPPKEEPAPVPPPPKEPAGPPPVLVDFGKFLSGEFEVKDAEKMAPLLKGLVDVAQKPGPYQNLGRVGWTIVTQCIDGAWTLASEDRPAFKEYAEKFMLSADHRGAVLHLAKAAEGVEPFARWRILRMLALVHLSIAIKDPASPLKMELGTRCKVFELNDAGITLEGESILAFKDAKTPEPWKKAPKVRDPVRDVYRAIVVFDGIAHAGAKIAGDLINDARAFFATPDPAAAKLLAAMKTSLETHRPCKACEGLHDKRCTAGCDEKGKKEFVCQQCGGDGFIGEGRRRMPCRANPPEGGKWEKGKHKCLIDCAACKGKGVVACKACSAPWNGEALLEGSKVDACGLCSGSGWLIEDVRLPCYRCFGTGKHYSGLIKR